MSRNKCIILPVLQCLLAKAGENIQLARLRRNFSAAIVAERTGISRNTLRAIEHGDPNVGFGAYAKVLLCLGLENDISLIGNDDILGRKLQDAGLPIKVHMRRAKKKL